MKTSRPRTSRARTLLGAVVLPVSLVLTVFAHAADHAASAHTHLLKSGVRVLAQRGPAPVPFEPAEGLGMAIILVSALVWAISRSRLRLHPVNVGM